MNQPALNSGNDLLIFGGAYSNLQATEKLYQIANTLQFKPANIVCTGDVVGYCAQPQETVDLIQNWGIHVIAGNVEVQLRDGSDDCGCNFDEGSRCDLLSKGWFPFAQAHLNAPAIDWMKNLPLTKTVSMNGLQFQAIHGGYPNISEFIFKSTEQDVKTNIASQFEAEVILAGHCGLPFGDSIGQQMWVNSGVIGMPANDGTPRCWFAIYRTDTKSVEWHSFLYDHQTTHDLMVKNNLPLPYAKTILSGIWDNCDILPKAETALQGQSIQADFEWA